MRSSKYWYFISNHGHQKPPSETASPRGTPPSSPRGGDQKGRLFELEIALEEERKKTEEMRSNFSKEMKKLKKNIDKRKATQQLLEESVEEYKSKYDELVKVQEADKSSHLAQELQFEK